jgi:hypothetical protein
MNFSEEFIEQSNLLEFKCDALDFGPEGTLPYNLSDTWLRKIDRDMRMLMKNDGDSGNLTVPLAMVTHLLFWKRREDENTVSFSEQELFNYIEQLHFEITLELFRRISGEDIVPATLETIFSENRYSS